MPIATRREFLHFLAGAALLPLVLESGRTTITPSHTYTGALILAPPGCGLSTPATTLDTAPLPGPIRTVRSGAWRDPRTWDQGRVPITGDQVTIEAGHTIVVNAALDLQSRTG